MVTTADLATISSLQQEVNELTYAVELLENNGRITAMRIVSEQDVPPAHEVTANTAFMEYPQAMIDNIIAQMNAHILEIKNQLTDLGMTD